MNILFIITGSLFILGALCLLIDSVAPGFFFTLINLLTGSNIAEYGVGCTCDMGLNENGTRCTKCESFPETKNTIYSIKDTKEERTKEEQVNVIEEKRAARNTHPNRIGDNKPLKRKIA